MTAPVTTPSQASYDAAVSRIRAQTAAYAAAVWGVGAIAMTDLMVARLVGLVAPAVEAAQLSVANLTSVYLASQTGSDPLPVNPDIVVARGVPNDVVYKRPVVTARTAVSKGKSADEALAAGGRRLESLATTDIQMAKVRQADASLAHAGVTKYRRVPRGAATCALCLIASTQEYSVGTLAPIHPGCDCGVDVIPPGMDLDDIIDADGILEATHAKVKALTGVEDRGGRAVDYRKLIVTRDHGEIGPLVAWDGENFTGPGDLPGPAPDPVSVFDLAPTDLDDIVRGPNSPSFVPSDLSRGESDANLAGLLASIGDI